MASPETVRVTGPGGLRGTIDTAAWPMDGSRAEVLVQIEGGTSVLVPLEALVRQGDGSYYLTLDPASRGWRGRRGERPSPGVARDRGSHRGAYIPGGEGPRPHP